MIPNTDEISSTEASHQQFPEIWYDIVEENHFWFYWRFRTLLRVLKKLNISLNQAHKAFDIGSGNGLLISQLEAKSSWIIDACDVSPKFVGKLNTRGTYFQYNIFEKRAELEDKYDFIFVFDVLEHLSKPQLFLDTASFYLKDNGLLFINTPALQWLYSNYDKAGGHKRRYSKKSILALASTANFVVEDFRYWGMALIPLVLARKALTSFSTNEDKILTRGMKTPNKLLNSALKQLAYFETSLVEYPPLGASLMLTLRKIPDKK